jgi:predicted nucleic-acid-binding protein
MNILIDTNIVLDFLLRREPHIKNAGIIFKACKEFKINGFIAAHSIPDIFYIMRKSYTLYELKEIIKLLANFISIINLTEEMILSALSEHNFSDFEDSLQDECAQEINADYIITRNVNDFAHSKVKAIEPKEFIKNVLTI